MDSLREKVWNGKVTDSGIAMYVPRLPYHSGLYFYFGKFPSIAVVCVGSADAAQRLVGGRLAGAATAQPDHGVRGEE